MRIAPPGRQSRNHPRHDGQRMIPSTTRSARRHPPPPGLQGPQQDDGPRVRRGHTDRRDQDDRGITCKLHNVSVRSALAWLSRDERPLAMAGPAPVEGAHATPTRALYTTVTTKVHLGVRIARRGRRGMAKGIPLSRLWPPPPRPRPELPPLPGEGRWPNAGRSSSSMWPTW